MAEVIRMPRMSDTMTEGVIVDWHKKVGDTVSSGDLLAEVETDKATMELESYQDGVLLFIGVEKGSAVEVDGIMAILGGKGEDYSSILEEEAAKVKEQPIEEAKTPVAGSAPAAAKAAPPPPPAKLPSFAPSTASVQPMAAPTNGRVKASPLAKKLAKDHGIDISVVGGSGEEGRVVKRDIEAFVKAGGATKTVYAEVVTEEGFTEVGVSQMRKAISRRLSESKFSAPHFYLTIDIDMGPAMQSRKSINDLSAVKVSFNDMVIKAAALGLRNHPAVNSSWLEDRIRYNEHVHIGMAVAIDDGLIVPVIRFADSKLLSEIAADTKSLGKKAKERTLQPQDWEGNTFTISNLGMMGIEEFTAIINTPEACIMAVGTIREEPVVKNGQIVVGHRMKVTLSCDHRVVDGATGARFLQSFKTFMEDPLRMVAYGKV